MNKTQSKLEALFNPKLSIITIVYNNVRDIERTILSVIGQQYTNIEYIIVDGGSNDGTLAIIKSYEDQLAVLISEPDKGIYDAMNKGLRCASGDYVLFMNSGDELYDPHTVQTVFSSQANADIYYGETELFDEHWNSLGLRRHRVPEHFNWKSFRYGMNICHQAIYVKRTIAPAYDETYRLSADVDWVINCAKNASTTVNVHRLVAKYLVGGISKTQQKKSLKERFKIFSKHYGLLTNCFNHLVILARFILFYINKGFKKQTTTN